MLMANLPSLMRENKVMEKHNVIVAAFIICIGTMEVLGHAHGQASSAHLTPAMFIKGKSSISTQNFQLFKIKNALYRLGSRKIVIIGVGPLRCIPNQLSVLKGNNSCVEQVNNLATMFNSRLIQLTNTVNASLSSSSFVYLNTYDLIYDMVTSPSKYGFVVPNRACCGNGRYGDLTCLPLQQPCANRNQYIFWDSFYPIQAVNAIVAGSCYGKSTTKCYPIGYRPPGTTIDWEKREEESIVVQAST